MRPVNLAREQLECCENRLAFQSPHFDDDFVRIVHKIVGMQVFLNLKLVIIRR